METEKSRDLAQVLDMCAMIERHRGEFYDILAEAYRDSPKVSALFHKTANEERNHEYQFLLALKKFIPVISGNVVSIGDVAKCAAHARWMLESIRSEVPTIEDALMMSILSETVFRQFHMDLAVVMENDSLAALFRAMMAEDDEHIESLKQAHGEFRRMNSPR